MQKILGLSFYFAKKNMIQTLVFDNQQSVPLGKQYILCEVVFCFVYKKKNTIFLATKYSANFFNILVS